jgi:hypothetical protein
LHPRLASGAGVASSYDPTVKVAPISSAHLRIEIRLEPTGALPGRFGLDKMAGRARGALSGEPGLVRLKLRQNRKGKRFSASRNREDAKKSV